MAWGPLAGYFGAQASPPLDVVALDPVPGTPFQFSISMGVRQDDRGLRDRLNEVLRRKREDIDRILDRFHVPRAAAAGAHVQARQ